MGEQEGRGKGGKTEFIFESIDVLMVTGARVLAVLDEETESPDPQRRRPP